MFMFVKLFVISLCWGHFNCSRWYGALVALAVVPSRARDRGAGAGGQPVESRADAHGPKKKDLGSVRYFRGDKCVTAASRSDGGRFIGRASVDAPDLHATRIGEGRLVALLPAGHPWEGRAAVSQEEIAAEPRLIGMPLDRPIGRLVAHLAPADGAGGRERITASSLLAVPNLVRTLGRVSIVDEFTAEAATHVGVAAVPIAPPLVFEIQALSVRPLETRRAGPILVEALRGLLAAR